MQDWVKRELNRRKLRVRLLENFERSELEQTSECSGQGANPGGNIGSAQKAGGVRLDYKPSDSKGVEAGGSGG